MVNHVSLKIPHIFSRSEVETPDVLLLSKVTDFYILIAYFHFDLHFLPVVRSSHLSQADNVW